MHFRQIHAIIFIPEIIPGNCNSSLFFYLFKLNLRNLNIYYVRLYLLAPTQASAQEGTMLLLRSGSDISITDAWENSSLSNPTTDINKHRWSVQEIIEVGGNFRSPIIDQLNQSTLTEVFFFLFSSIILSIFLSVYISFFRSFCPFFLSFFQQP